MLTQTQQVDLTLHHLKERALAEYSPKQRATVEASEDWKQFDRRLNEHFPKLMHELDNVYNDNEAVLPMLEQLIAQAWQSYSQRDKSLKAIDAERESDPDWILSNKQVGGVCYVDLFAGDLKGLKAKIPYFQELGLTYLHMMPLFKCPEGKSDGGYAVSSYRDVNPALGTIDDLRDVIAALHEAGISAEERARRYVSAEAMLQRDDAFIPLYHQVSINLVKPDIQGYSDRDPLKNYTIKNWSFAPKK